MLGSGGLGLRFWAGVFVTALAVQADLLAQFAGEDGGSNDPYFSYGFAPQPPVAGQLHAALTPFNYTASGCNYPAGSPGWCIPTEWCQISSFPSAGAKFMHGSTLANCTPANRYCAPAITFQTRGGTADYATLNISVAPPAIVTGTTLDSVILYVYADGVQLLRTEGPTVGVFNVSIPGGAKQNITILADPRGSCEYDGIHIAAKYFSLVSPPPSPSASVSPTASMSRSASRSASASKSPSLSPSQSPSVSPSMQPTLLAQFAGADAGASDPYFSYGYAPQPPVAGQRQGSLLPLSYSTSCVTAPFGAPSGWCLPSEWCLITVDPIWGAKIMHGSTLADCSSQARYCAPALTFKTGRASASYAVLNISRAPPPIISGTMYDSVVFYIYADGVEVQRTVAPTVGISTVTFPGGAKQNVTIVSDPGLSCSSDGVYLAAAFYGFPAPSPIVSAGTSPSATVSSTASASSSASSTASSSSTASTTSSASATATSTSSSSATASSTASSSVSPSNPESPSVSASATASSSLTPSVTPSPTASGSVGTCGFIPGFYCPQPLGVPSLCPVGSICPDGRSRQPCPLGYFCREGTAYLTPSAKCPEGFICDVGVTAPSPAPPGRFAVAGSTLFHTICAPGFFCAGGCATMFGERCTTGLSTHTGSNGSVSISSSSNSSFAVNASSRGGLCPAGTYCPPASGAPIACDQGTFSNESGRVGPCDDCPVGRFNPHTGASSLSACITCGKGYTTARPGTTARAACIPVEVPCPAGTAPLRRPVLSVANCGQLECGGGLVVAATESACRGCPPGFYGTQDNCLPCNASSGQVCSGLLSAPIPSLTDLRSSLLLLQQSAGASATASAASRRLAFAAGHAAEDADADVDAHLHEVGTALSPLRQLTTSSTATLSGGCAAMAAAAQRLTQALAASPVDDSTPIAIAVSWHVGYTVVIVLGSAALLSVCLLSAVGMRQPPVPAASANSLAVLAASTISPADTSGSQVTLAAVGKATPPPAGAAAFSAAAAEAPPAVTAQHEGCPRRCLAICDRCSLKHSVQPFTTPLKATTPLGGACSLLAILAIAVTWAVLIVQREAAPYLMTSTVEGLSQAQFDAPVTASLGATPSGFSGVTVVVTGGGEAGRCAEATWTTSGLAGGHFALTSNTTCGAASQLVFSCPQCVLAPESRLDVALHWSCQALLLEAYAVDPFGRMSTWNISIAEPAAPAPSADDVVTRVQLLSAVHWDVANMLITVTDITKAGSPQTQGYQVLGSSAEIDVVAVPRTEFMPSAQAVDVIVLLAPISFYRAVVISERVPFSELAASLLGMLGLGGIFAALFVTTEPRIVRWLPSAGWAGPKGAVGAQP